MNFALAAGVAALELVLPAGCAGCGSSDRKQPRSGPLCSGCRSAVQLAAPLAWELGGPVGQPDLRAFAAATYDGVVRSMLLEFKERGRLSLRRPLADCLAISLAAACANAGDGTPVLVVPVPSARASRRARGHDPVGDLAHTAARQLRASRPPVDVRPVLRQIRAVADQSGLGIAGRQANLLGALEVAKRGAVSGRRVIVVDDIVTTGATAIEAARALTAGGATVCGIAAVAATIRHHPATSSMSSMPLREAVVSD